MEISHKIDNSALLAIFGDIDREIRQPKHGYLQFVRGSFATRMSALGSRSPEVLSLSAEGGEGWCPPAKVKYLLVRPSTPRSKDITGRVGDWSYWSGQWERRN